MTDTDLKTELKAAHKRLLQRYVFPTTNFPQLAQWSRQVNALNGWRPDYTPQQAFGELPELLVLIHTEITETFQARSVPAQSEELADVMIRAFDICELLRPGQLPYFDLKTRVPVTASLPVSLLELHAYTDAAMEAYRKIGDQGQAITAILGHLRDLFALAHDLITEYGHDSRLLIVGKLLKNLERGHRHGGRRA